MSDALSLVTLKNGEQVPQVLVNLVLMHLEDLMEKADFNHPVHKGNGMASRSYMLALYDLLQLCKDVAYSSSCFGGNRQKLLERVLVEGGPTGPLSVRPEIRAIVLASVTYDPATTMIRVLSPV